MAKSIDEMSEAEIDALMKKEGLAPGQDKPVDNMSEEEIDALLKKEDVGPLESFITSAADSYTLGYQPQIETVLEGLVPGTGKPFSQALPGSDEYIKRRDELLQEQKRVEEANPSSSLAGKVTGAFLPNPANVGRYVKGATTAGKAGIATADALLTSAAVNPGDQKGETGLQLRDRLSNVADTITDPIMATMLAVPYAPVIGEKLRGAVKPSMAEKMAVKNLRPNMKDYRALISDTGVSEKEVGRYLLDNKILSPGKDLETVYDTLKDNAKETGRAINGFYKNNAEKIADYFGKNPQEFNDYQQETFNWVKEYNEARKRVSDAYKNSGQKQKALDAVENYFEDLHQGYKMPDKKMRKPDLTELSDIKTGLDDRINYEKDAKDTIAEGVFKILRSQINGKIKEELKYMGKALGGDAASELAGLNKKFSIEKTAEKLANKAYAKGETSSDALYRAMGFGSGFLLGSGDIPTKLAYAATGALAAPMVRNAALGVSNMAKRGAPNFIDQLSNPINVASPTIRAMGSLQNQYIQMTPVEMEQEVRNDKSLSPTEKARKIDLIRRMRQ